MHLLDFLGITTKSQWEESQCYICGAPVNKYVKYPDLPLECDYHKQIREYGELWRY